MKHYKFNPPIEQYWFTGCTHVFHNKEFIWQKRGYASISAHAEAVQKAINEKVKPQDTLFHLGDGFLNSTEEQVAEWLMGINCQNIYYITGNHESAMSQMYRRAIILSGFPDVKWICVYPVRFRNVIFLGDKAEIGIGNRMITLTHYPHLVWNKSHHGAWNLHSHCHGSLAASLPAHTLAKRLDVGWDVFARPVNLTEIDSIMAAKQIEILDHHNSATT